MISGATVLLEKKEGDGRKWNKVDRHDAREAKSFLTNKALMHKKDKNKNFNYIGILTIERERDLFRYTQ